MKYSFSAFAVLFFLAGCGSQSGGNQPADNHQAEVKSDVTPVVKADVQPSVQQSGQPESKDAEDKSLDATAVLTEWSLGTEFSKTVVSNLGWKENGVDESSVILYDYSRIATANEVQFLYRTFKVPTSGSAQALSSTATSNPDLWNKRALGMKTTHSWSNKILLWGRIKSIDDNAKLRAQKCRDHKLAEKIRSAPSIGARGPLLLRSGSLFYADRELSTVQTGIVIDNSKRKVVGLADHVSDGQWSASEFPGHPETNLDILTAGADDFKKYGIVDVKDSYVFRIACDSAHEYTSSRLGKDKSLIDYEAAPNVDRFLADAEKTFAAANGGRKFEDMRRKSD